MPVPVSPKYSGVRTARVARATGRGLMMLHELVAVGLLAFAASAGAAEDSAQQRPRDAAEAVREGDVSQWLKYYQRERAAPESAPPPAGTPPAPAETQEQSAPHKR